jgi:hypothetical protein
MFMGFFREPPKKNSGDGLNNVTLHSMLKGAKNHTTLFFLVCP